MSGYKLVALALALVVASTLCLSSVAYAGVIEDALKIFGIAYVVRTFGGQINDFINSVTAQGGVKWEGITKVVPIISVGTGTYVGAAQVQGPSDRVDETRAVGQVETRISDLRARLLVPVNTTDVTRDIARIRGVGVSALVDFKI